MLISEILRPEYLCFAYEFDIKGDLRVPQKRQENLKRIGGIYRSVGSSTNGLPATIGTVSGIFAQLGLTPSLRLNWHCINSLARCFITVERRSFPSITYEVASVYRFAISNKQQGHADLLL